MLPVRARLPDESAAAKPWSAASALMGLGRDLGKSLTQLARSWAPPEEDPLPGTPRNGGTIAVGTASGRLRVVNALTGDSLLNVEHHQGHSLPVLCVAMSSDGSLLASGLAHLQTLGVLAPLPNRQKSLTPCMEPAGLSFPHSQTPSVIARTKLEDGLDANKACPSFPQTREVSARAVPEHGRLVSCQEVPALVTLSALAHP